MLCLSWPYEGNFKKTHISFNVLIILEVNLTAGDLFAVGFGFAEVAKARASSTKVVCCHFSSDGKLLATGGHDKKVSDYTALI